MRARDQPVVPLDPFPPLQTLIEVLQQRAAQDPDRPLYHMVRDGWFDTPPVAPESISAGDVHYSAAATAATLSELAAVGSRILLSFNTGLEFVSALFGCLYAGMIPVPVYPPGRGFNDEPVQRLHGIVRDCQPAAALTGGSAARNIHRVTETNTELPWLNTDLVELSAGDGWTPPTVNSSDIALLQYTSGSTGTPRGVMLSHRNLLANQAVLRQAFAHIGRAGPDSSVVSWLPFHHDMGLMGSVIHPLYNDVPVYYLSPLDFLRRPVRWLQLISRLGSVTSGGPGFAWDLCCEKVTEAQKDDLDLSRWKGAYIGADRISPRTLKRFADCFSSCGFDPRSFYPCYGLAESTLFVTGGDFREAPVVQSPPAAATCPEPPRLPSGPEHRLVGCGQPWGDHDVQIIDPETDCPCANGEEGEIHVSGPSVARGYWNQPEDTAGTFVTRPNEDGLSTRMLRTGDLGFVIDNELFITGRRKDVIIIRGVNYHPQDIEAAVCSLHPAFPSSATAAIGHRTDTEEQLVLLQEIRRHSGPLPTDDIRRRIRQQITSIFQLQVADIVLVRAGSLPRTSSGKIRRSACRQRYSTSQLQLWQETSSA